MSAKRKRKIPMAVEGPAIIAPDHAQNRPFALETEGRGRPQVAPVKGWRRLSPLEQAFLKGQLAGGRAAHDAEARFAAGKRYGEMFALAQSSGRDSTDLDRITKSSGGASIGASQAAA